MACIDVRGQYRRRISELELAAGQDLSLGIILQFPCALTPTLNNIGGKDHSSVNIHLTG